MNKIIIFKINVTFAFNLLFIGAYNYGYEVGPNGQFHHETRGPDGVTYGCYGHIDSNALIRVTHYVADSQGYRTVEAQKPVLVFPYETYEEKYTHLFFFFLIKSSCP